MGLGRVGQHLTISLLLGALVLAAPLTDTSWAGSGRAVQDSLRLFARLCFSSFLPFPPRQRISCAVTAPGALVAGGVASPLSSVLVAHGAQVRGSELLQTDKHLSHLLKLLPRAEAPALNPLSPPHMATCLVPPALG